MINLKINLQASWGKMDEFAKYINKSIEKAGTEMLRRLAMLGAAIVRKHARNIRGYGPGTVEKYVTYGKDSNDQYSIRIQHALAQLIETGKTEDGSSVIEAKNPRGMIVFNEEFYSMRYDSRYVKNLSQHMASLKTDADGNTRIVDPVYDFEAIQRDSHGQAIRRADEVNINRVPFAEPAVIEMQSSAFQKRIDEIMAHEGQKAGLS